MDKKTAIAFAPAAISNFFSIHYDAQKNSDLTKAGATGGGYVLSEGVVSKATVVPGGKGPRITVVVDGDENYEARTTRRAVSLFLQDHPLPSRKLHIEQDMRVPVGSGFGASAAAAISSVYASAAAMNLRLTKEALAYYAHVADIQEQTGLGTVSVTYRRTGAGAIIKPGAPGVSRFLNVMIEPGTRIVTASLGPFKKSEAFSDPALSRKICISGDAALERFIASPSLDNLAAQGERFSADVGLMTRDLRSLAKIAVKEGASHASQNMIGYSIHALTSSKNAPRVAAALAESTLKPRVDTFSVGDMPARVLGSSLS